MASGVSIKDIARAAGVTHSTVSRALRGDRRISSATAQRIRQLAAEMGYTPSAVARSLVTRRTRTVGLVVTSIADPFVPAVIDGVEHTALEAGYTTILATSRSEPERELSVVRLLQERRVDGIIITASRVGALYAGMLATMQVPVVLVNNQEEGEYLYSVSVDDVAGARMGVEHLLHIGHRRIAFIGCPLRPSSHMRRRQGYLEALAKEGLPANPGWLLEDASIGDDVERGMLGMRHLLSLAERPTAVFCYNDMTAIGALREAQRQGIEVPADVSLLGFDGIREAELVQPSLTTLRQPRYEMGREAMTMLLKLLDGQPVHDQLFQPRLVIGGSTAPPRNRVE
jgi:DNA-binding LacI/PurR family transcriptional regulator